MIGDVNHFRPAPRAGASSRKRYLDRAARYLEPAQGPDGPAIDALLSQEDSLVSQLQASRDALGVELAVAPADIAADYQGVIDQIEAFVEKIPRLEEKARAGDLAQAQRLVDSTTRILACVRGTNPLTDVADNVKATVAGAAADVIPKTEAVAKAAATIAIAIAVVVIAVTFLGKSSGGGAA